MTEPPSLAPEIPLIPPQAIFAWEAVVEIGAMLPLGRGPLGERRLIPITGGRFAGPRIAGIIMPGGADRQLVREDGVRHLEAIYELQADDGAIISVRNHVVIAPRESQEDYRFSTLDITAPEGPHAWINRVAFVGTLHSLRPAREAVLIRVFALG